MRNLYTIVVASVALVFLTTGCEPKKPAGDGLITGGVISTPTIRRQRTHSRLLPKQRPGRLNSRQRPQSALEALLTGRTSR
jgi:hypothetical protein